MLCFVKFAKLIRAIIRCHVQRIHFPCRPHLLGDHFLGLRHRKFEKSLVGIIDIALIGKLQQLERELLFLVLKKVVLWLK